MKKSNITVIVFFVVAIAFLSVASMVNPIREYSESENRVLAQMPDFSLKSVFDGSFTKDYESFVTDQFVWRDLWIKIKSGVERTMGKTLSNGVYFADDGYFIEHKSESDIDSELLDKNIGFLENHVKKMSEVIDGKVLVSIAPTASVILKDKLPPLNDEYDFDTKLDYVRDSLGENFVDLRDALYESREEYIFYRTDHHWTGEGAYIAYREIAEKLGFTPLDESEIEKETVSTDFLGTVIAKLNIKAEPDTITSYKPGNNTVESVNYNLGAKVTDTLYSDEKLQTRDKYAYFLGGNDALIEINTSVYNGRVLMLAKDSFANCMISLLTAHFEKIYVVDLRYFNLGLVEYTKTLGDVTDSLVLYNISGYADDRYAFKLAR